MFLTRAVKPIEWADGSGKRLGKVDGVLLFQICGPFEEPPMPYTVSATMIGFGYGRVVHSVEEGEAVAAEWLSKFVQRLTRNRLTTRR